ncbi:MAG: hypothetical protein HYY57_07750 [Candidatus Omnitrophica bacterium]|nr:hypothetical protein [Candidatus Omnitrophota bacterium]
MPSSTEKSRGGLFLFLGPDRARKLQRIEQFQQRLGIGLLDTHRVDASTMADSELLLLCRQQPAASPLRLIVVDQAHCLDSKRVDALLHHADSIATNACVVLLTEIPLGLRHALSLAQKALVTETFESQAAAIFKPFAFTDALGNGDRTGALAAAQDQIRRGKEPLELLGVVGWQLNRWLITKRLLDSGADEAALVQTMNLKPWQAQRLRQEVLPRAMDRLQANLRECWRLDVDAKSGRILPQQALETLIVSVCQTRAD